ncbi:hypothetical protein FQR65_LT14396 [Abscondita terminalis]|nr:hypothetical protein FQR65_LT14396 [Abscondita terminalis]
MLAYTRYILIPTIFLLICIRKYKERGWGKCKNAVKLNGKVAIVTGANSGIGYEITKELALRGAQVIMACRDLNKAAKAMYKIKQEIKSTSILVPMELDLSSLESIKGFCDEVITTYQQIHVLVNNAGVSYPKNVKAQTKDGLEIHFGVNYFGHYVLTTLLLTALANAESSRIIVISSMLHENGKLHLHDLNLERVTEKTDAYANSKLANVYFCKELSSRLHGTNIRVMAVCPGWAYTNLFRHNCLKWYQILLSIPFAFLFMRTAKQGAQTAIFCATEPNLQSGCVYRNCQKYKSKVEHDVEISNRLWHQTEEIAKRLDHSLALGIILDAPFQ